MGSYFWNRARAPRAARIASIPPPRIATAWASSTLPAGPTGTSQRGSRREPVAMTKGPGRARRRRLGSAGGGGASGGRGRPQTAPRRGGGGARVGAGRAWAGGAAPPPLLPAGAEAAARLRRVASAARQAQISTPDRDRNRH